MKMIGAALVVIAAVAGTPASAQSASLGQAIASGQVGERFDGYLGYTASASADVRRQVSAVNIRRRNLYVELANRRNVTVQLVGTATACELLAQVAVGQSYMLQDGVWRRRAAGQAVALPGYCR